MPQLRPITWATGGWLGVFVLLAIVFGPEMALSAFVPSGLVVLLGLLGIAHLTRTKP